MRFVPLIFATLGFSHAVMISSGDGSGNTSAPADDPGFANVGTLGGASAVYLGNQWVLTANHVGRVTVPNEVPVIFGGVSFEVEAGSGRRLENPTGQNLSQFTDLIMYRLINDPGLTPLDLVMNTVSAGTDVIMIGNGRGREVDQTRWNVTVDPAGPDTWTETTSPFADVRGWRAVGSKEVRWGENSVTGSAIVDLGATDGDVVSFFTTFDRFGRTHEAQASNGDSGGAVFLQENGVWKLGGILNAVGTGNTFPFDGRPPGETSSNPYPYFGRVSTAADLSVYESQIEAIRAIPEPSAAFLLMLSGVFLRGRSRS